MFKVIYIKLFQILPVLHSVARWRTMGNTVSTNKVVAKKDKLQKPCGPYTLYTGCDMNMNAPV